MKLTTYDSIESKPRITSATFPKIKQNSHHTFHPSNTKQRSIQETKPQNVLKQIDTERERRNHFCQGQIKREVMVAPQLVTITRLVPLLSCSTHGFCCLLIGYTRLLIIFSTKLWIVFSYLTKEETITLLTQINTD